MNFFTYHIRTHLIFFCFYQNFYLHFIIFFHFNRYRFN